MICILRQQRIASEGRIIRIVAIRGKDHAVCGLIEGSRRRCLCGQYTGRRGGHCHAWIQYQWLT